MSSALLGLTAGVAAGVVMSRSGLCFNRAVRHAVFERRPTILRAFGIAVAFQLLALPLLVALGVGPLGRNAGAGGPPLLPAAQLLGGLCFGAGMALAGGCVTGMLWKTGGGALALVLAVAGFVAGELLIRGPGDSVIRSLDDVARPGENSLSGLLGLGYEPLSLALGVAGLVALLRRRDGLNAGLALGTVAAATWIAADAAGYGYGLGFVGAADGTRGAIDGGGELPFQLWLAVGVLAGGLTNQGRGLRVPDTALRPCCSWRRDDGRGRQPRPRLQHRPRPDRAAAAVVRIADRHREHGSRCPAHLEVRARFAPCAPRPRTTDPRLSPSLQLSSRTGSV